MLSQAILDEIAREVQDVCDAQDALAVAQLDEEVKQAFAEEAESELSTAKAATETAERELKKQKHRLMQTIQSASGCNLSPRVFRSN